VKSAAFPTTVAATAAAAAATTTKTTVDCSLSQSQNTATLA
jgi:hypothetical protein